MSELVEICTPYKDSAVQTFDSLLSAAKYPVLAGTGRVYEQIRDSGTVSSNENELIDVYTSDTSEAGEIITGTNKADETTGVYKGIWGETGARIRAEAGAEGDDAYTRVRASLNAEIRARARAFFVAQVRAH